MKQETAPYMTRLFYRILIILVLFELVVSVPIVIDLILHPIAPDYYFDSVLVRLIQGWLIGPVTAAIGLLCIRRAPGNIVGPLVALIGIGLFNGSLRTNVEPIVKAASSWLYGGTEWFSFFILFSYFPTGQIYPRRFGNVMSGLHILSFIGLAADIFSATTYSATPTDKYLPNPLFIPALAPLQALFSIAEVILLITIVFAAITLILRYRLGDNKEKQQLKWLIWGFAVFMLLALGAAWLSQGSDPQSIVRQLDILMTDAVAGFLPAFAVGNAILRHRLYDIDIIIRRTLIYGVLTGILAAVYFGTVVLVQQVFRALTGQTSDLAVVISTLVIAALVNPLRRRIQNVIGRRLYRRKYNAEKTLAAFSRTLREDVDIETLKGTLIDVVQETMQPTHVALWVGDPVRKSTSEGQK